MTEVSQRRGSNGHSFEKHYNFFFCETSIQRSPLGQAKVSLNEGGSLIDLICCIQRIIWVACFHKQISLQYIGSEERMLMSGNLRRKPITVVGFTKTMGEVQASLQCQCEETGFENWLVWIRQQDGKFILIRHHSNLVRFLRILFMRTRHEPMTSPS